MTKQKSMAHLPSPLCDGSVFSTPKTSVLVDRVARLHRELHDIAKTLEDDITLTPQARTATLSEWAARREKEHAGCLTEAIYAIADRENAANAVINNSLSLPTGGSIVIMEIRSALRGLPEDQRGDMIYQAIKAKDRMTVAAATNGPSWLSGISDSQEAMYRHQWAVEHHQDQLAELEAVRVDTARLDGVVSSATQKWNEVISAGQEALSAQARTRNALAK